MPIMNMLFCVEIKVDCNQTNKNTLKRTIKVGFYPYQEVQFIHDFDYARW
jgi:hypothetical protein